MRARSPLFFLMLAGLATSLAAACGTEFTSTPPTTGSTTGSGGSTTGTGGASSTTTTGTGGASTTSSTTGTGGTGTTSSTGTAGSTTSAGGGGGMPCNDVDGDGVTTCNNDCNDNDPAVHPGAFELCGDGVDNDCSGGADNGCAGGLGTYVSNGGDDGDPGTQDKPVKTIGQGMKNAVALGNGQAVFVAKGHYPEKVKLIQGVSLLGGYDPSDWGRDIANNDTAILCQDALCVEADATITRVTLIDGFRIQGGAGQNNGKAGGCVTVLGGSPTITNNVINGPVEANGGVSSYCVLILSPTNDPLGALIEANLITGGAAAETSIGVVLASSVFPPVQPGAIAEIKENKIRAGNAKRSHGVEIATGGNGTRVIGNQIDAGTSNNGDSWGLVLSASSIGGQYLIDSNFVNADAQNMGACNGIVANSYGWCGGIDNQAAKSTIVNNVIFGLLGQKSAAVWLRNPEASPETVVLSSNILVGAGTANAPTAVSAAIVLTVNNGNTAMIGRIRNNVLAAGVAAGRFGVYEDSLAGKTCHPEALTNNDFVFDPLGSVTDSYYRFWDGAVPQKYATLVQVNAITGAAKNFAADPKIDNNLHLMAGSPCIDSGTQIEAPTKDFEGDPRPMGGGFDVGPDEH